MAEADLPPTLSVRDLELHEYKLTERVQEKLLSRAKIMFGVFLAGLTFLGVFGTSLLVEHLSNKVAKDIRQQMANKTAALTRETEALNRRLTETLAALNVSAAEIQQRAEKAKGQLEALTVDYKKLEDLGSRYTKLHTEVVILSKDLNTTTTAVREARAETSSLRSSLVDSATGKPSILNASWALTPDKTTLASASIFGSNLGSQPGKVRLMVTFSPSTHSGGNTSLRTDFIDIDPQSVADWKADRIEFAFTPAMRKRLTLQLKTWGPEFVAGTRSIEFEVRTHDGQIATTSLWTLWVKKEPASFPFDG